MLADAISATEVDSLSGSMATLLGEHEMLRGWDYYRRGLVYGLVVNKPFVQATVQGTYPYLVRMDLENGRQSKCSCPVSGPCKHIAAVFIYLYALYNQPEELIQLYRSHAGTSGPLSRVFTPTPPIPEAGPDDSTEEWYSYIKDKFKAGFKAHRANYQYGLFFYNSTYTQFETYCREWPERPRSLFLLLSQIFIMEKIEQPTEEERAVFGYYLQYPGSAIEQHQSNLRSLLLNVVPEVDREESREALLKVAAILRNMLALEKIRHRFDWQAIYRQVWDLFMSSPVLLQEEVGELERLLRKRTMLPRVTLQLAVARAHFIFAAGNDEEFRIYIDDYKGIPLGALLPYVGEILDLGDLERLTVWLEWLLPRVEMAQEQDFARVCDYWVELARDQAYHLRLLEVLRSWLPRSSEFYSLALVHTGHWKDWADFQIFHKRLISDISSLELKLVEKKDRTLLFPLYHHSVARLVNEKNRMAYQRAVRLLKKLKTLYKKVGQEEQWEVFIRLLAGKYSRLRAFQDELRKGKLLYD